MRAARHKADPENGLASMQQMQPHEFAPMPAASDHRGDMLASKQNGFAPAHAATEDKADREDMFASMQKMSGCRSIGASECQFRGRFRPPLPAFVAPPPPP